MTREFFEQVLYQSEGTSLDFKREQYPFTKGDEEKSELLKDVLAFANAFRQTTAYILIGVEERKGDRAEVYGITELLDDAHLQQFVNGKTQRPITFSYQNFDYDGKKVGVIEIPIQRRPFFLKRDYGKIKAGAVYYRQGSSTAVANADAIALMGASDASTQQAVTPRLVPKLLPAGQSHPVEIMPDSEIPLTATLLQNPTLPEITVRPDGTAVNADVPDDDDFVNQVMHYTRIKFLAQPVRLVLQNTGSVSVASVEIHIYSPFAGLLMFWDESDFPDRPHARDYLGGYIASLPRIRTSTDIDVERTAADWHVTARFKNIFPGVERTTSDVFYVAAVQSGVTQLKCSIHGDRLDSHIEIPFRLKWDVAPRAMTSTDMGMDGKD
jgi:hypothetical protein